MKKMRWERGRSFSMKEEKLQIEWKHLVRPFIVVKRRKALLPTHQASATEFVDTIRCSRATNDPFRLTL